MGSNASADKLSVSTKSKHGFTDLPATNDSLNANRFCSGLTEFIETCDTPMTIAIQGDWGTGKSTALQLIQNQLSIDNERHPDEPIAFSTLDTWQYSTLQQGELLPFYLLLSIYNSILQCTGQEESKEPKDIIAEIRDEIVSHKDEIKTAGITASSFIGSMWNMPVFSAIVDMLSNIPEKETTSQSEAVAATRKNAHVDLPAQIIKNKINSMIQNAVHPL